jgi:hypothetical protein
MPARDGEEGFEVGPASAAARAVTFSLRIRMSHPADSCLRDGARRLGAASAQGSVSCGGRGFMVNKNHGKPGRDLAMMKGIIGQMF